MTLIPSGFTRKKTDWTSQEASIDEAWARPALRARLLQPNRGVDRQTGRKRTGGLGGNIVSMRV